MDWITGIQRALDYTEAHLTETIDYGSVAKQALSSAFHFQRMFGMLCGCSLGDYIRMRRLSLAAEELCRTNARVLDVALKYGYDTPESFSRAFARFHGITPSEAKRGKNVKSFSRLSVKLILSGGNTMDYRIEKKEAFSLVCADRTYKLRFRGRGGIRCGRIKALLSSSGQRVRERGRPGRDFLTPGVDPGRRKA